MTTPPDDGWAAGSGRGDDAAAPIWSHEVQGLVYEAEILSDAESEEVARRIAMANAGGADLQRQSTWIVPQMVDRAGHAVARTAAAVWRSEHVLRARCVLAYRARKAPLDLIRLCWFGLRGHVRWARKAWTFISYGDLRCDVRVARLAGDAEARRAAQEMIRADSRARWARSGIVLERAGTAAWIAGGAGLVLWLVDSMMSRSGMWPWLAGLYGVIGATWSVLAAVVPGLAVLVLVGWIVAAVYEGRDKAPGAGWLVQPERDDTDSWVDERMISKALAHLGISPLDRFFKGGGELVYTVAARVDGDGTYAQVRLPMGVTAGMVADRRDRLAANLGRAKLETWPTEANEAGLLDLWIADKGKLGRGAGRWPLLDDGQLDIFDGIPIGRSQRGHVLYAPVLERNYLVGGIPGQGKTSFVRTLAVGAALDPTVEVRVFVFASNPDFDPLAPRLAVYVKGDDDDAVEAGLVELRRLRDEVTRRGKLLERHAAAKVTRRLADTVTELHPSVVIFDECHELFEHPKHGAEAADLAVKVIKKGRKTGITLIFATVSPSATSIPKEVTRNCSNGVAFAVADHYANDGLLGSGKHKAGIRATELRPGEDRGTAVTTGLTVNRFELLNTFYIAFDEGNDQLTPVITRAMTQLQEHGLNVPASTDHEDDQPPEPVVDHLADIQTIMRGEPRVRTQLVLRRLAETHPAQYGDWTFYDLAEALADAGIAARKSDGVMVIRATDITRALRERDDHEHEHD